MKLQLITLVFLLQYNLSLGQEKFIEKDGVVTFFSSAPLEDIEAENKQVTSIIDLSNNSVAISIPINGFKFDKSLMEEHFNENYLESEKYPKAIFQGSFISDKKIDISKKFTHKVKVDGKLTMHGVTRQLTTDATIETGGGDLNTKTQFNIRIADYNIKIPKMVFKNIAEVVEVKAHLSYESLTQ